MSDMDPFTVCDDCWRLLMGERHPGATPDYALISLAELLRTPLCPRCSASGAEWQRRQSLIVARLP